MGDVAGVDSVLKEAVIFTITGLPRQRLEGGRRAREDRPPWGSEVRRVGCWARCWVVCLVACRVGCRTRRRCSVVACWVVVGRRHCVDGIFKGILQLELNTEAFLASLSPPPYHCNRNRGWLKSRMGLGSGGY